MYSSTHSLTSAQDGDEWSASLAGRFTAQGKSTRYPLYRRLGGPQGWYGHGVEEKDSQPPAGNRTLEYPIVQPVASCYTD
jgi:hypothetical protein